MEKIFAYKHSLSEAYSHGNDNYHYSLLNDKDEPAHTFFQCKDYYHDLMYAQIFGKGFSIYQYTCKKSKHLQFLLEPGFFKIGLRYGKYRNATFTEAEKKGINAQNLFNCLSGFEDKLGLDRSDVTEHEGYLLIKSSTDWLQIPFLSSLYFTLLRIGNNYQGEDLKEFFTQYPSKNSGGDANNVRGVTGNYPTLIDEILENQFSKSNFYKSQGDSIDTSYVHNSNGMSNFARGVGREEFKTKQTMKELIAYSKKYHTAASVEEPAVA